MIFNSLDFVIFIIIVFVMYWSLNSKMKFQNLFLLLSSYFFYCWWDWRFLFLLILVSVVNYTVGLKLYNKNNQSRKAWLLAGLIINILVLTYFKYFNFFVDSFIDAFSLIDVDIQKPSLNIILPLGISFYIFLSLSYIIDIYNNKLKAEKNIVNVLLSLSFFPIIFAGPIQKPSSLLPQIRSKRIFKYEFAVDGLKQILWGLFMKVVIADKCALIVNNIFSDFNNYKSSSLVVGGVLFMIQIYADFGGYSLIAIGVSRLLGFEINSNFRYPYFADNFPEFWKRWHISLTSWFRDYIFLPLSFFISRKIPAERYFSINADLIIYMTGIVFTWLLTGLWHGANLTFILWGLLNGMILVLYRIAKKNRRSLIKKLKKYNISSILTAAESILTLIFILFLWIIFRSNNISEAFSYLSGILSMSGLSKPDMMILKNNRDLFILIAIFFLIEWIGRNQDYPIFSIFNKWKRPLRWVMYYSILICILWYAGNEQEFFYFQF